MLTRQGWLALTGGAAVILTARLLGIGELYVFGACALGLVAFAAVYVGTKRLDLEVERTVQPARVHAGHSSRVDLRIRNLRATDTPVLRLDDPVSGTRGAELLVPPLSRGAVAVATYRLPTDRRGLLRVGPLSVAVSDPFGLTRTAIPAADAIEVTVYPRIEEITPVPFTAGHDPTAGARQPHALGRAGDDFYALRTYVVGDDLRRIHWPSTARHDELLVRHQEQPWQGRTTILLDVRRSTHDETSFETAVSAAASIAVANGARRDLIRVLTTDGIDSGFGTGHAHVQAVLEHLAVVQMTGTASLRALIEVVSKNGGGGALVVVLAQVTTDELTGIGRLRSRYGSVTVVVTGDVRVRTPAATTGAAVPVVRGRTTRDFATAWDAAVKAQRSGHRSSVRTGVGR